LHAGHIALVTQAVGQCDLVVASIFVNPIQFNNPDDLKKYPRTFDSDRKMLEEAGCDLVFYPSVDEMYPDKVQEKFDFGSLETVMEGATRPGHFNGVAVVVKRLFDLVQPDIAFFGKKDFQNLYPTVPNVTEKVAVAIEKAGFKCVSVENAYRNIPTVISDNFGGTKQILNYLFTLGHKKIAMVIPPLKSLAGRERFEAYKIFLKNHNLVYDENLVVECEEYTDESAKLATEQLLNKCLDDFPTAIFAGYDKIAFIIERTLLARGYSIPNDISVVGFDDLELARSVTPTLTTVYQNRKVIGEEAARIMLQRLEGDDSFETNTITRIPTGLRIRNSTCRARNN